MIAAQIEALWPLSASYEYAAEIGLLIRNMRNGWWAEFEQTGRARYPLAQSAGIAFLAYLENHDEVDTDELKALCEAALVDKPDFMTKELQASFECIDRDYSRTTDSQFEVQDVSNAVVSLFKPEIFKARAIDEWTDEIMNQALVEEHRTQPAEPQSLRSAHSQYYCEGLIELEEKGGGALTPETIVEPGTLDVILSSVGCLKEATLHALSERAPTTICQVATGSHHAAKNRGGGTCIVNNIAIAARSALRHVDRVAIIDIDAHHGNGTEDVFYEDERVLTLSIHQHNPFFPGSGDVGRIGHGIGRGFNLNIEVSPEQQWIEELREGLIRVQRFAPQIVFIEYSTDAHILDPVSDLSASTADFYEAVSMIGELHVPSVYELGASLDKNAWQEGLSALILASNAS